ncbi:neo-calmodulin-like [Tubulanus polymorphus]|uniref:neo-calmodulin-like n=1 Tax=Tubulanus polymorphus TaxID=672921 RepID=UPI003DA6BC4E
MKWSILSYTALVTRLPGDRQAESKQTPTHSNHKYRTNALSEELIAELKEAFEIYDTNGDGHISKSEIANVMRRMGLLYSDSELDEMLAEIDSDGDGTVDFGEFLSFMVISLDQAKTSDVVLMEAFRQFDIGNKGYLNESDLQKALSILGDGNDTIRRDVHSVLLDADLDGDGKITFQEFANIVVAGQMNHTDIRRLH